LESRSPEKIVEFSKIATISSDRILAQTSFDSTVIEKYLNEGFVSHEQERP